MLRRVADNTVVLEKRAHEHDPRRRAIPPTIYQYLSAPYTTQHTATSSDSQQTKMLTRPVIRSI